MGPDHVCSGESTSLFGVQLSRFNNTNTSYIYVRPWSADASVSSIPCTVTTVNPYKVTFTIPTNLPPNPTNQPVVLDIKDEGVEYHTHTVKLEGMQFDAYKHRAEKVLNALLEKSDVLKKIRAGKSVTEQDTKNLAEKVMELDPEFSLEGILSLFADSKEGMATSFCSRSRLSPSCATNSLR